MKEVKEVVSYHSSVYWTGSYRIKRIYFYNCVAEPFRTAKQTGQCVCLTTVEGKASPLQVWTDPEVSRRIRLPDFKTIGT
jgi:hypothetical protein